MLRSFRIPDLRLPPLTPKITKGTCNWIEERKKYQDWCDGKPMHNKLWIYGGLGCGKTYLAKQIVNLQNRPLLNGETKDTIAQCFLDEIRMGRKTVKSVLLFLLHMVLEAHKTLIMECMDDEGWSKYYTRMENKEEVWDLSTLKILWPKVMREVIKIGNLTLVIDGFDQCEYVEEDMEDFCQCLTGWEQAASDAGRFRLLIFSRQCKAFYELTEDKPLFETYLIEFDDTRADIAATVREALESATKILKYSDELKKKMYEEIPKGANGMYLWAKIMMDDITIACFSEGDMDARLRSLPKGIIMLYDSILGRISETKANQKFVQMVLFWVACHLDTLDTEELKIGLAMSSLTDEHPDRGIDEDGIRKFMPNVDVNRAVTLCCGQLVKICGRHLNLVHSSLREFLLTPTTSIVKRYPEVAHHKNYFYDEKHSHKRIGDFCVAYLLLASFANSGKPYAHEPPGPEDWAVKVNNRIKENKFNRYAALKWIKHLEISGHPFSVNYRENKNADQKALLLVEKLYKSEYAVCWTEVWWYIEQWKWHHPKYPTKDFPFEVRFPSQEVQFTDKTPSVPDWMNGIIVRQSAIRRPGSSRPTLKLRTLGKDSKPTCKAPNESQTCLPPVEAPPVEAPPRISSPAPFPPSTPMQGPFPTGGSGNGLQDKHTSVFEFKFSYHSSSRDVNFAMKREQPQKIPIAATPASLKNAKERGLGPDKQPRVQIRTARLIATELTRGLLPHNRQKRVEPTDTS